jgi:hypothetical protein
MAIDPNLVLPAVETKAPVLSNEANLDTAFYTAGSSSPNPIEDFKTIATELSQKGQSDIVDNAKAAWEKEQDVALKDSVKMFIEDASIPLDQKRSALELYATGGYLSKDIRDKYVQKVAATEVGTTHKEKEAQDENVKNLQLRLNKIASDQQKEDIVNSKDSFADWMGASGSVLSDIGTGALAGIAGVITAVGRMDALAGQDLAREWSSILQDNPTDPNVIRIKESIFDKLSLLGVPAKKVEEMLINSGLSGGTALTISVIVDPVNIIPLGEAAKALGKVRRGLGPKVRPSSPLKTTIAANPAVAKDLIDDAITDPTGSVASSLGTDKGTLINEFVYPNALSKAEIKAHPDLAKEILAADKEITSDFLNEMFDPNIQNATRRFEDIDATYKLLQESRGPYYNQSQSNILITDNVFEGKAILGPNGTHTYYDINDVVNGYSVFDAKRKELPEGQRGELYILDTTTGIKYTPESLIADRKWAPTTKVITQEIPGTKRTKAVIDSDEEFRAKVEARLVDIETKFNERAALPPEIKATKEQKSAILKEMKDREVLKLITKREAAIADNNKIDTEVVPNVISTREISIPSIEPKQFYLEWNWKKEYDELSLRVFGNDAVKTSVLGIDASALARSKVGNWIFGTGRFPTWFEDSALRMSERAAKRTALIMSTIKSKIGTTKHPKELAKLIDEAESKGIDHFSTKAIASRFPNLSTKEVDDLFQTHTYWRRVNHWNWALANYQFINLLYKQGYTKGLYVDSKYIGAVNENISFAHAGMTPKKVWDYETNSAVPFTMLPTKKGAGVFDVSTKQLVQLKKPMSNDLGQIFEYALIGDTKTRLDMLPSNVLPRIPGYSPVKTKAHFFIDITPTKLEINGVTVTDPLRLRTHTETVASAKTQYEANILRKEFESRYPNHIVKDRPDRGASYGRIIDESEAHSNLLRNAMQRGEKLEGTGTIEDRLTTLIDTSQSLARQNSMRIWEDTTQKSFVKDYNQFLVDDKFPESSNDIHPLPNMNREELRAFQEANRVFEYYAKLKSFSTWGDAVWKDAFHGLADVFEKWKIPSNLVRDIANKGNLIAEIPKQLASTMFIHLNPIKQWIIQPAQLLELYAIYPTTALKNFADLGAIRLALASRSPIFKGKASIYEDLARKMSPGMDKVEFNKTVKAIEDSGLLQSIDHNLLVHGVFNDVSRGLNEGTWEGAYRNLTAIPKAVVKGSRAVGFDFSELNNRLGIWLQVRDIWKSRNPGKDWDTLETKEYISVEANKLAGSMNKAGSLPYQKGALAVLFQFAAISQKQTLNLIQDNATLLSPNRRAALAATRAALWGTKYGLIGGAAIYYYIDRSENEEVRKYADELKVGLSDRIFNQFLRAVTGSEYSEVNISTTMSPYGNSTVGLPYVDVLFEMAKLVDDKPTSPRFPALGAIDTASSAINTFQSYFITEELTVENAGKAFMEAASVASGMSNWSKSQLMFAMGDKVTKNGNHLGLKASKAEALAQMFGFTTTREESFYEIFNATMDDKAEIDAMATDIHQQLMLKKKRDGDTHAPMDYQAMNSFIAVLKDDTGNWPQSRINKVVEKVLEKDRQSYLDSDQSILMDLVKNGANMNDKRVQYIIPKLESTLNLETEEGKATQDLINILKNRGQL